VEENADELKTEDMKKVDEVKKNLPEVESESPQKVNESS